ncbi:MAG: WecB/TagA/CpsF family glycosyltransferase [bacterium]|nr:WecB/TagA/CpsF family glycosyltransferase [bacterium]
MTKNLLPVLETKTFFALPIVNENWSTWQAWLQSFLLNKKSSLQIVMTPNPEQIMLARRDRRFYQGLQAADLLLPDGSGLVWASGARAQLTGSDSVVEILRLARAHKLKILLIGGRYNGDKNGQILANQTRIYYTQGYQNINQPTQKETDSIKLLISDLRPDVVLVAFGAPAQEKWLKASRTFLQKNSVRLAMSVGGSFDFILGKVKRAPASWRKLHLEWLWRLFQEPCRLKRQLVLPQFAFLVWTKKLR